jgi:hypothetical protein
MERRYVKQALRTASGFASAETAAGPFATHFIWEFDNVT